MAQLRCVVTHGDARVCEVSCDDLKALPWASHGGNLISDHGTCAQRRVKHDGGAHHGGGEDRIAMHLSHGHIER